MNNTTPLIKESNLAEITVKAVILAVIITAILAAANAYLALKLGQTISASIPAAVIAMGALRFFKKHNILENNIVQTAASAGEGVASAISFVLPALIIIGYWQNFNYWQTTMLIVVGGTLGVLFSIPLRRVMLNYPSLRFPEGTAIGNVLKASTNTGKSKMKFVALGGLVGGLIGLFQTGFKVFAESWQLWFGNSRIVYGFSLGFSPALIAAGFIVGMQPCIALLVGQVLGWWIGVPFLTHYYGMPAGSSFYDMAMNLRAEHIRYIGVGTMLLGGAWTLLTLLLPISRGVAASIKALKNTSSNLGETIVVPRTERDIPIHYVGIAIVIMSIACWFVLYQILGSSQSSMSHPLFLGITFFSLFYILIGGFFIASVCAYLSGLVGMTNNPLSGLLLGSVLISSLILLPLLSIEIGGDSDLHKIGIPIVIIVTTIVATIIAISGENIQDLKAGNMVGATPWKQQIMLFIGVIVAAFVIGPVLELLYQAYGIGGVFPRPGMDATQMLGAPQAGLMAAVAQGVFGHSLPVVDISIGVGIALIAIIIDERLKRYNLRLPILGIGIGIYLPPDITSAVILGGILNYICRRVMARRGLNQKNLTPEKAHAEELVESGTLLACGIVAGAALMGVLLAIPFVIRGSSDALSLVSDSFAPIAAVLGFGATVALCYWLYHTTCNKKG